jgi:oligopeptide/dipeptide ABC transporter ATP-binding protein
VRGRKHELMPIPGSPPSSINLPDGCAFHPRCAFAMDVCRVDRPELMSVDRLGTLHQSACWLPRDGSWWESRAAGEPQAARADRGGAANHRWTAGPGRRSGAAGGRPSSMSVEEIIT